MTPAYTSHRLDDPRIAKLRELLDQATKLLDGANELVADLTEQIERTAGANSQQGSASGERRRKSPTASTHHSDASAPQHR